MMSKGLIAIGNVYKCNVVKSQYLHIYKVIIWFSLAQSLGAITGYFV